MRPQSPNLAFFYALFDLLIRVVFIVLAVDPRSAGPGSFSSLVPRIPFAAAPFDPVRSTPCCPRNISPFICRYVGIPLTERTVVLDGATSDGRVVLLRLREMNHTGHLLYLPCCHCALMAEVPGEGDVCALLERDNKDWPLFQEILILQNGCSSIVDIRLRPGTRIPWKPVQLALVKEYLPNGKQCAFFLHCSMVLR